MVKFIKFESVKVSTWHFIFFIFIILISFSIKSYAAGEGGELFASMKNGFDAKSIGLGMSNSAAMFQNNNGFYYNPALSGFKSKQILSLSVSEPYSKIDGIKSYSISYLQPGINFNYGVLLNSFKIDDIREAEESGLLTGNTFSDNDILLMFNISKEFEKTFITGINIKYLRKKIYNYSDNLISSDIGFFYHLNKLDLGFSINNIISTKLKLRDKEERINVYGKGGFSFYLLPDLVILSDLKLSEHSKINSYVGVDYNITHNIDLYSGYNNENELFAIGFGLNLKYYTLNYTLSYNETLEEGHRFTLELKF
jgi:hypothetical protein